MSECGLTPANNGGEKRMMYVGVDVGKSKCRAAMMNQDGKITKEFDFSNNSQKGISNLASMLTLDDKVVIKSDKVDARILVHLLRADLTRNVTCRQKK